MRIKKSVLRKFLLLILIILCFSAIYLIKNLGNENIESKVINNNVVVEDILLVNEWNPLPMDYTFKMIELDNGHSVNEVCYEDLIEMINDCKSLGLQPVICSSYRSYGKQQYLFDKKVNTLQQQGYSLEDAKQEARKSIAMPGTSEHQTGLAVDIVDLNNQNLDESQEDTAVQKWLMDNSWKYGFILRYPEGKSEITGIIYEPWHYRYVGKKVAKEIYRLDICLEEYLKGL